MLLDRRYVPRISCCEAEVMLLDRRYVPRISSISVRQEIRTKDLVS